MLLYWICPQMEKISDTNTSSYKTLSQNCLAYYYFMFKSNGIHKKVCILR